MSFIYERGLERILGPVTDQTNWITQTVKIVFVSSSYTPDATHEFLSSISPHTGSVIAATLTNKGALNGIASASNVTITGLNPSSVYPYMVIYRSGSTVANSPLIAFLNSGSCVGMPITAVIQKTVHWATSTSRIFEMKSTFGTTSVT